MAKTAKRKTKQKRTKRTDIQSDSSRILFRNGMYFGLGIIILVTAVLFTNIVFLLGAYKISSLTQPAYLLGFVIFGTFGTGYFLCNNNIQRRLLKNKKDFAKKLQLLRKKLNYLTRT